MERKLQRNKQEQMIAGVCAGLAEYLDVDVTWIRIAFAIAFFTPVGIPAYLILWVAAPTKPITPNAKFSTDYRVYQEHTSLDNSIDPNQPLNPSPKVEVKKESKSSVVVGLLFIAFGGFFLLDNFNIIPYWFDFGKLWPLVFIIPGIVMITKAQKKQPLKENFQNKQDWNAKPENKTTDTDQPII